MEISVRECTLDDLLDFNNLFNLSESFHREHFPTRFRKPNSDYSEILLKKSLNDENIKIYLASIENKVVGYVYVLIKELPNNPIIRPGKIISVEQLVVLPEVRRKKVGIFLMNAAEAFAKSKGFSNLQLHVWKFNETAEKFYENIGYEVSSTVMTKKIID